MTIPSTPPSMRHPMSYDEAVLAWLAGEDETWWTSVREQTEQRAC